jgi:hypothetical protein
MTDTQADTPWNLSPAHMQRIRVRAYQLWESEGRPAGQDAIEANAAGLQPNPLIADPDRDPSDPLVEEAALELNLGEFPALFTDQGDRMPTPETRKVARKFRSGER